jgi:hypothetical protein
MNQFTIYDNVLSKEENKNYSFNYLITTNLISFIIGVGFHYLVS